MKKVTFSEFDAFAETVTDVDCVMTLRNPRHRTWVIHQVELPRTHIQLGRLGSGNLVEGQSWSHGYLFYLPLTDKCTYTANGEVIPPHSFMILEPNCEFSICTADQHDWCSIFVPEDLISNYIDTDSFSDSGPGQCRVSEADPDSALRLSTSVSQLIRNAIENPNLETSPAAPVAERELVKIASTVLRNPRADSHNNGGRPQVPRQLIIDRCKKYLAESCASAASASDLAAASGVSERTLRSAFNDYYGMCPTQYFQLRQLNRVHQDLRASSPEEHKVADILLRHGIWEHGRFASRYQQLFGEKPSITLRSTLR
jgi:AraC-like DNA-binding protein